MSKYRHQCCEWDGMLIEETDMEFAACSCFDDQEAKDASEARRRELDGCNQCAPGSCTGACVKRPR